jgi:hypothetical protein
VKLLVVVVRLRQQCLLGLVLLTRLLSAVAVLAVMKCQVSQASQVLLLAQTFQLLLLMVADSAAAQQQAAQAVAAVVVAVITRVGLLVREQRHPYKVSTVAQAVVVVSTLVLVVVLVRLAVLQDYLQQVVQVCRQALQVQP